LRGIGPCYEDKIGRRGIRIGDLFNSDILNKNLTATLEYWRPMLEQRGAKVPDVQEVTDLLSPLARRIEPYVKDTVELVHTALKNNARILLEGAQGAMLDIDHGTYPFVTSSNTVSGAATSGIGIGPTHIDEVVAIAKAYTTRVGGGPFPTELNDKNGEHMRDVGAEYGSTTGRPRRCGWFDAVVAKRAMQISGATFLAITKLDVLTGLDQIKICIGYKLDGKEIKGIPMHGLDRVEPVYKTVPGWKEDISFAKTEDDLPEQAKNYLKEISTLSECPVCLISVGPGREQTILTQNPFKKQ
jgi:adenylosuccinate synthase